ncbi:hypothetical protein [Jannaschia pohangensis]|uniref:Lipoprotein n=1 Tax=Jannaschia pohangensis TaxID=390807 RepID=A0A1I3H210_9RHOB|nr:hypothetical protein [Jannaschia pohangensis]SFI29731.1 hypothetical protein SAMN04488095_0423 [Jannaschia pohangensis]
MKRILPLFLFLAACGIGTSPVWLKPGTPTLTAEQDFLACAAQARRDFPETRRITTAPSVVIGGGLCRDGVCVGVNDRPDVFETDRNDPLRARAINACMEAKGYQRTTLPVCAAGATQLASQPFDTRGLCVANGRIASP